MTDLYILIVDDKPQNLYALEKTLEQVNAKVIKANSGEEALSKTLDYDFALAILDVQMPNMNGYELADLLLGDPSTSRMPIIFLTAAFGDEQHSFQGYESGAVDYIVKPFNPVIFISKVNVFLELARYRISLEETIQERTYALLAKGNKLKLLVENTPDCILNLDPNGTINFINHLDANTDIIGRSVFDFFDENQIELQKNALQKVFEKNQIAEFESYMKLPWNPEGSWYSHRLAPIPQHANIRECVQISRDITHKKAAEEAQLKIIQAEAHSQAKSKFLSSVSHEIRTPMNAVLGYAQLLSRDTNLTETQKEYLDIIDRSGEHLLMLIDSVLDMAKIEAGQISLSPSRTNLHHLLNDLYKMFILSAQKKGLQLTIDLSQDLPEWIYIDANKVRQILINLLGNAFKFTQLGSIKIRASLVEQIYDYHSIRIEIEDTGCGIEKEMLETIFVAFEQAHAGTQTTGAGLGLAVSQEFALLMNGNISLKSELNRGSTFIFEFRTTLSEDYSSNHYFKTINKFKPSGTEELILIVDDDIDNLQLLGKMVEAVGFKTHLVNNGQDALSFLYRQKPSMIILDLKMNHMDGIALTKKIRNSEIHSEVPIIMVTASPFTINKELAFEAGVNKFLCKPIREKILYQEMGQLIPFDFSYTQDNNNEAEEKQIVDANRIQSLPLSIRSGLKDAIESGYTTNINRWIEQTESHDAETANTLRYMSQKFDYISMLTLLNIKD